jgi:hypothetical protein
MRNGYAGDLCNAITGRSGIQAMLERVERGPVQPADPVGGGGHGDIPGPARPRLFVGIAQRRLRYGGGQHQAVGVYDRITWGFVRYILGYRRNMAPQVHALISPVSPPPSRLGRSPADSGTTAGPWPGRHPEPAMIAPDGPGCG